MHEGALAFLVVVSSSHKSEEKNFKKSKHATLSAASSSSHVEISSFDHESPRLINGVRLHQAQIFFETTKLFNLLYATLRVYPGAPHGLPTVRQDQLNEDLLAFISLMILKYKALNFHLFSSF